MSEFHRFSLAAPILKALAQEGYERPTPIQAEAIPHVMAGRDLQGIAQTGTGKTAAFALPILHRLSGSPKRPRPRGCRALVLSPTRELASQIAESFVAYGRHLRLSVSVVYGGVPVGRQQRALAAGVDILVATPGRLLDLVDQRSLTLQDVEILVLDEADQMLDLGFIHALRRIVTLVPKVRQTLFFSATMPKSIEALSAQFITDPVKVAVAPVATTAEKVEQRVMFVSQGDKPALLRSILRDPAIERVLVFTRTKHGADRVVTQLGRSGVSAAAIHGNKSQGQRERALADFKHGRAPVLVATDIAARGIDVDGVTHVVNFDLPNVPESYVHRIGRTARAGAAGQAISFCNGEERAYLRDIEKLTRLKVPVAALPSDFAATRAEEPPPGNDARPSPHSRSAPRSAAPRGGQARRPDGQRPRPERQEGKRPEGPHAQGRRHEPRRSETARADHRPSRQGEGGAPNGQRVSAAPRPERGPAGAGRAHGSDRPQGGRPEGRSLAWLDRR